MLTRAELAEIRVAVIGHMKDGGIEFSMLDVSKVESVIQSTINQTIATLMGRHDTARNNADATADDDWDNDAHDRCRIRGYGGR